MFHAYPLLATDLRVAYVHRLCQFNYTDRESDAIKLIIPQIMWQHNQYDQLLFHEYLLAQCNMLNIQDHNKYIIVSACRLCIELIEVDCQLQSMSFSSG